MVPLVLYQITLRQGPCTPLLMTIVRWSTGGAKGAPLRVMYWGEVANRWAEGALSPGNVLG